MFLQSQLWKPEIWPERQKISFGKLLSAKVSSDAAMAEQIDQRVETDYRTKL